MEDSFSWKEDDDELLQQEALELQRVREAVLSRGFEVGKTVVLRDLDLRGVVVGITSAPTRVPINVRREDGETFAYSPDALELVA